MWHKIKCHNHIFNTKQDYQTIEPMNDDQSNNASAATQPAAQEAHNEDGSMMTVNIRTLSGQVHPLRVGSDDTLRVVKQYIRERIGEPRMRLVANGKELCCDVPCGNWKWSTCANITLTARPLTCARSKR